MLCHFTPGRSFIVIVRWSGDSSHDWATSPSTPSSCALVRLPGLKPRRRPITVSVKGTAAAGFCIGSRLGTSALTLRFRVPPRFASFVVSTGTVSRLDTGALLLPPLPPLLELPPHAARNAAPRAPAPVATI